MKVRKQSQFPIDLLLKLAGRPLLLGPEIVASHYRGYVFTGTMIDESGVIFKWRWRLPLAARSAYLKGWSPAYLILTWFGLVESPQGDYIYQFPVGPLKPWIFKEDPTVS